MDGRDPGEWIDNYLIGLVYHQSSNLENELKEILLERKNERIRMGNAFNYSSMHVLLL